jgi:hypothetical protein
MAVLPLGRLEALCPARMHLVITRHKIGAYARTLAFVFKGKHSSLLSFQSACIHAAFHVGTA